MRSGTGGRGSHARQGFVMALVVLMLFAISVTAAAAYLTVRTEHQMARHQTQGAAALAIARGGLHRFAAEQLGAVADSARYAFGGGEAFVRARRIARLDPENDVYYLRAEGTVDDVFTPASPAIRVIGAYAYHRKRPMALHAAVILDAQTFRLGPGASVSGQDVGGAACPPAPPLAGAVARGAVVQEVSGQLTGSPPAPLWPDGHAAIRDSLGLRWDVLADPSFPVDFDGVLPDFGALPPDAFPVVRFDGDLHADGSWSGRGVLLVTGEFGSQASFAWSGIVLAGRTEAQLDGTIDGVLVGGLADAPRAEVEARGTIRYHSCNVRRANEALSHLEVDERTIFEPG